ncbi:MAG: terminase family protein [Gammaproteobacteria bacterium]
MSRLKAISFDLDKDIHDRRAKTIELIAILEEEKRRKIENRLFNFRPYPWQFKFYAEGVSNRQRLLMAANRVGKTLSSCNEVGYHATGIYPDWWPGVRIEHPITGWIMGVSGEQIRDVTQKEMFGRLLDDGFEGGGIIPTSLIDQRGIIRAKDKTAKDVRIKHISGGWSTISLKSYTQGQHVLMGSGIDLVLIDEEPEDQQIWPQVLTRTMTGRRGKGGLVILSFTPENGRTPLVCQFMDDIQKGQYLQTATWDDAPHLNEDVKAELLASYLPHQRDMRSKGIPMMGEGLIFSMDDDDVSEPALENIPNFWPRLIGTDFGIAHPAALAWIAYDRDNDIMHVYDVWRKPGCSAIDIVGVIKSRPDSWVPVAWPHDGLQHDKGSGIQLKSQYEAQGAYMLPKHATFSDGSNGLEAAVFEMGERIRTGRLKVAAHLSEFFEEKRLYHRARPKNVKSLVAEPQIVKLRDDILCAIRYAMMMLRYAETEPVQEHYEEERERETWY